MVCFMQHALQGGRVYDSCFKGKVRGAGQGRSTVAEAGLTTHVQLLVPVI